MFEVFGYSFMHRAVAAAVFGGLSCGIVGVWVIMLKIPFVGVAMSHAAFAGAVLGLLIGLDPLLMALIFCLGSTLLIGPVSEKADIDPNISIGIIFSVLLGLAFLCMGLMSGPKTEALQLIWGSILTVTGRDVFLMAAGSLMVLIFLALLFKEIKVVLFNREIARATGIPEKLLFYALLFLCGISITLNLNTIGGLLIFSLIINPPSAAYQLTYNLKMMYVLSVVFAVSSCLLGLLFSCILNVPSGAVIIIASSVIFGVSLIFSRKKASRYGPS